MIDPARIPLASQKSWYAWWHDPIRGSKSKILEAELFSGTCLPLESFDLKAVS